MPELFSRPMTDRRSEAVYFCLLCQEPHAACMLLFTGHAIYAKDGYIARVAHVTTHEEET